MENPEEEDEHRIITFVMCPNIDSFHGHDPKIVFVQYIFFGTSIFLEDPNAKEVRHAMNHFKGYKKDIVFVPCGGCTARGIKGLSHFTHEELFEKYYPKEDK